MVGVTAGAATKAYPLETLAKQSPIIDELGGIPIVVVSAAMGNLFVLSREWLMGARSSSLARKDRRQLVLVDAETASEWDFTGKAISGQMSGQQLKKVTVLIDYWFDWKTYHPMTVSTTGVI